MAILDDIKTALRIDGSDFDTEVGDLIDACIADMVSSGIVASAAVTTDPLVKMAVVTYCKANFSDGPSSDKLQASYESIRNKLTQIAEYRPVVES